MSIEINGPHGRPPGEVGENRRTSEQTAKEPAAERPSSSGSASDKVSLTSAAVQLQALEDQIAELPVVDTKRVEEVQRSLATGSFQIDPASVADKMLQFEAALGTDK